MMKTFLVLACMLLMCRVSLGDTESEEKVSEGANCFTLKMYQQLAKTNENFVSSPYSLDVLLSILYAGAGGKTAQELSNSLGYNGLSVEDVENAFQSKLGKLNNGDNNTLETANSIWFQKGFEIKPSFKDIVAGKFYSQESNVDFAGNPHGATEEINKWGNEKTHGLIPKLLSEDVDQSTIMFLVNAIYFKGQWKTKFQKRKTKPGKFNNNDCTNSPSTVKLMNQRSKFLYHEDDALGAQVLEMNYVGDNISMVLILPQEGSNIGSLEKALTCDTFKSGIRSSSSKLVDVTMPKFKLSSSFNLIKPIMDVGIINAFEGSANFSGIAPNIAVSKAIQKAIIKVYEEGSEAAALTGVGIMRISSLARPRPEVVYFRADHPFVYMIRDKRTNLVLFMGRVKNLPNAA